MIILSVCFSFTDLCLLICITQSFKIRRSLNFLWEHCPTYIVTRKNWVIAMLYRIYRQRLCSIFEEGSPCAVVMKVKKGKIGICRQKVKYHCTLLPFLFIIFNYFLIIVI